MVAVFLKNQEFERYSLRTDFWRLKRKTWLECIHCEWLLGAVVKVLHQVDRVPVGHVALLRGRLPYSRYGCGASNCVSRRNSSCCWYPSDIMNSWNSVTTRTTPSQALDRVYSTDSPNHFHLPRQLCQAKARWRVEWRCVVFSDECRFLLGASDGHVLVKRRPGKHLEPNCLQPRCIRLTTGVIVWGEISYDSRSTVVVSPNTLTGNLFVSLIIQTIGLPLMNSIQGGVFQQDNPRSCTAFVTQCTLQSVDMLPWPERSVSN
ncbi:transposable element Tc1 transposase [Trichonephila clavipes]|nr:transposable element Tc1 transposase [Trichonephila clavipes]